MSGLYGLIMLNEYRVQHDAARCDRSCGAALNNIEPSNIWCHAKSNVYTPVIDGRPEDYKKCSTDRMCMGKLTDCSGYDSINYCIKVRIPFFLFKIYVSYDIYALIDKLKLNQTVG